MIRYILPICFSLLLAGATFVVKERRAQRATASAPSAPAAAAQIDVVASSDYRYDAPPSISRDAYTAIVCQAGPACDDAGAMYDVLVEAGIDPAIEAAQAGHETGIGTQGIGQSQYKNLHGVQCHSGDGRIADSSVPWGNGCAGVYASYTDSVRTWAALINREYVALGLDTPALAVSKYAPVSDGNDPPAYVADMERHVDEWRAAYAAPVEAAPAPLAGSFTSSPISVGGDDCGWNVQVALDAMGGALRNVQIAPGETFSFNATMGSPAFIPYRTCAGVPGGNWCNLAARYAQVSRALGLVPQFQDHGVGDLGGGPENSVAIWNEGGHAGAGQDLLITNTLNRPVIFQAIDTGGSVIIEGGSL